MSKINTKDKTDKFTVRFNPEQLRFVRQMAEQQNVNPSEFIRQCVDYLRLTCEMALNVSAEMSDRDFKMATSLCGTQSTLVEQKTEDKPKTKKSPTKKTKVSRETSDVKEVKKGANK